MKTRPKNIEKIKWLYILNEQYDGDFKKMCEKEAIDERTIKKYVSELEDIYETQVDIYDQSKELRQRIYNDAHKIKDKKMELLDKSHDALIIIVDELKSRVKREKSAKEIAEIGKIISEIVKNNEGILDPEANNQATNPVNTVFTNITQQILNIKPQNGEENKPNKYKWDNPQLG